MIVRANGVTAENGWIDYEKKPAEHDGDDLLCWAASATLSLLALAGPDCPPQTKVRNRPSFLLFRKFRLESIAEID